MPTLHEGFGLVVGEAIMAGVPVIASDIPVLREQVEAMGAEILWMDPYDPASLTEQFCKLNRDYARLRRMAGEQINNVTRRTWAQVASDYMREFESAATLSDSVAS